MGTEFHYKLFPTEGGVWSYYGSYMPVSKFDLNSKVSIKEQWDTLDEEEKWVEINYCLMALGNIWGEFEELKNEKEEAKKGLQLQ